VKQHPNAPDHLQLNRRYETAKNNFTTVQSLDAARSLHDIHEDLVTRVSAFVQVARNEIANMDADTDGLSFLVAGLSLITNESIKQADQVSEKHSLYTGVQS
jgi:hypothetical protein